MPLPTHRPDRGVPARTCACACTAHVCVHVCMRECSEDEADLSPKFRSCDVSLGQRTKKSHLTQRCRFTRKAEI